MLGAVVLGAGVVEAFKQVPSLLGRQLEHCFPAFTQAQLLHEPVLLHLQHCTILTHTSILRSPYGEHCSNT